MHLFLQVNENGTLVDDGEVIRNKMAKKDNLSSDQANEIIKDCKDLREY